MNDAEKLNPEVKKVKVGKKNLIEISILPLSFSDQSIVLDKIFETILIGASSWVNLKETDVLLQAKAAITKNIELILGYVLDPDDELKSSDVMNAITNSQLLDIVESIWEVNYADPLEKKGLTLIAKIQTAFRMNMLSPQSPSVTQSPSEQSTPLLRRVD